MYPGTQRLHPMKYSTRLLQPSKPRVSSTTMVITPSIQLVVRYSFRTGMQRFGTASVPTHAIGLALLKSDWNRAISLILQKRHGEHPDVAAARDAWLVEGNLDKALSMLPRRVVAERCILESFKKMKGDIRNAMGALSTVGTQFTTHEGQWLTVV